MLICANLAAACSHAVAPPLSHTQTLLTSATTKAPAAAPAASEAPAAAPAAAKSSTGTPTPCRPCALWLRQEPLQRQQLHGVYEELVTSLVAGGNNTLRHLHSKVLQAQGNRGRGERALSAGPFPGGWWWSLEKARRRGQDQAKGWQCNCLSLISAAALHDWLTACSAVAVSARHSCAGTPPVMLPYRFLSKVPKQGALHTTSTFRCNLVSCVCAASHSPRC